MENENSFQSKLIKELHDLYPEAVILKNDPNYLQGFPDLTILEGDRWAVLETKKRTNARRQPNQEYYVDKLFEMSYSSFISPENKEQVLDELQQALRPKRPTQFLRR